jgi:hypothetical protein
MKSTAMAIATAAMLLSGSGLAFAQQPNTAGQQADNAAQQTGDAARRTSDALKINENPAVATTSGNASQPAKGSSSFTMAEAKNRLERSGFSNVANLAKDDDGIWRGQAQKNGNNTAVWLDYRGNSGEGK